MFFNITKVNEDCPKMEVVIYRKPMCISPVSFTQSHVHAWEITNSPRHVRAKSVCHYRLCLYVSYLYGHECKWDFRAAINKDFQQITYSEHKASAQFVWCDSFVLLCHFWSSAASILIPYHCMERGSVNIVLYSSSWIPQEKKKKITWCWVNLQF